MGLIAAPSAVGAPGGFTIVPSANPTGSFNSVLSGVSCSGGTCMAVGDYGPAIAPHALAEYSTGGAWTLALPQSPAAPGVLTSVSCTGPLACVAVGYTAGPGDVVRPLAEAWNGGSWTVQPTPEPAGAGVTASFASVDCTAPNACEAVGSLLGPGVQAESQPLAELWNGTSWALQAVPNPGSENGSGLTGVSCSSADACTAIGEAVFADVGQSVFADRWGGVVWGSQAQPNPGGVSFDEETGVACPAAGSCQAVGDYDDAAGIQLTLAEGWNGFRWRAELSQTPAGAITSTLSGVSCTLASACTAVGSWSSSPSETTGETLAERWNGLWWTRVQTPDPPGAKISELSSVDCLTDGCVAVGDSFNGLVTGTLVETSGTA